MEYTLSTTWTVVLLLLVLWELVWKGFALWKSARKGQSVWYVAILIINSLGILPIIYLSLDYIDRKSKVKEHVHHEKAVSI